MVGRVQFAQMDGNWAAKIWFGVFTLVLGVVVLNMVVAKINSIYSEVVRKGTLFYYQDLFDLRYLFRLDPQYGFLASLEHPFSLFLLPALCVLKCLERRKRREELTYQLNILLGLN